jgi:glucokinase
VADIGGTHARLARWSAATGLDSPLRVRNDDYHGPLALLEAWFERQPSRARRVLLALAMPVGGDTTQLTNRAWRFEPQALVKALRLQSLVLVNDFAAAAASIDALDAGHARPLNPESMAPVPGVRLVLGAGTGLGAAALVADQPPRVVASEAGHMTFGSGEAIAARLHADGRARWGRVSWERVLSGEGLRWLEATLANRDATPDAAEVARRAAAGDPQALAAVRLFSRLLGEFAGDLCLALLALEGVYLCGGVLRGIEQTFDAGAFLERFADKGRFSVPLARVPVYYAARAELGLQGAARFLGGRIRLPSVEWRA